MSSARRKKWSLGKKIGIALAGLAVLFVAAFGALILKARSFDNAPLPPALADVAQLPLVLPDGRHAALGESIRPGVPTVITFWASWCGPCFEEAPRIAELRRRFGPDRLNLIYLNVRDPLATREKLAGYMADYGMAPDGYAVLDDALIGKLTNTENHHIPRTLIFDRAGKPIGSITGYKPLALDRLAGIVNQ